MASTRRSTLHRLIGRILDEGGCLPFEGVVRTLEEAHPDAVALGHDGPPRAEIVRFKQNTSLGFASGDLNGVRRVADDGSGFRGFEVETNLMGLAGVDSPLPSAYAEAFQHAATDEEVNGNTDVMLGMLNIFHHRMISLLVRALRKYQHTATYRANGSDRLSQRLAGLAGGTASDDIDPGLQARFAGAFMRQARSESQIEAVLQAWFGEVPIAVTSCVPRWVQVPADQRLSLGRSNHQLGVDAVLGEFIRDSSSTFGLQVGPLTNEQFNDFLPNGAAAAELRSLLAQADVNGLGVRVQLQLDDEVSGMRLSSQPEEASALGWSSWLAGEIKRPTTVTYTWEDLGA